MVRDHEVAHVEFLQGALGDAANPKPTFDFGSTVTDVDQFVATSIVLEDTGVTAYNGQAVRLRKPTLAAAASIVSVEARHAAWIRHLAFGPDYDRAAQYPAPTAFDRLASARQVTNAVESTGFIQG